MDRRRVLFGMLALVLAGGLSGGGLIQAQSFKLMFETGSRSDRERDGLRGPVKHCIVDGHFTEYDLAGHRLRSLYQHSKWGDNWTYDNAGHLLRVTTQRPDGSSLSKTIHTTTREEFKPLWTAAEIKQLLPMMTKE